MYFARYKFVVAESLIEHFNPIRLEIENYLRNPEYLESILERGNDKAREVAQKTMDEVKAKVGLGHVTLPLQKGRFAEKIK